MMKKAIFAAVAAGLTLAGCLEQEEGVRIGSKNFGESRVLAEMMAAVSEELGVKVDGVVEYENTQAIVEALKRGDIDAYPEYNGTGLVMLGQNALSDGDAAQERVEELYEPLGVVWRKRFGFANNYGLALLPARAEELGVKTMSDLVAKAGELTLGVEDDFPNRPLDGLQPMSQRYGYEFGEIVEVPLSDRGTLYDQLLDGAIDIAEVYTTDGQIADYNLVILEDDLTFFPVYEAAAVARADSLAKHPGLGAAFDTLGGKITADAMQDLNRKVDLEGRSARAVARDALARMQLIKAGAVDAEDPLLIAASPIAAGSDAAASALRAARGAFTGREVKIDGVAAPLDAVAAGGARMALAGAESFFDVSGPAPVRDERFETVAVLGANALHLVTKGGEDGVVALDKADSITVGPEGSSSHQLGMILKDGLGLSADITASEAGSVEELVDSLKKGGVALVSAPAGDRALTKAFASGSLRLLPIKDWSEGANLVKYPFLRASRIPANSYQRQFAPIETLSSQLVLAGPAPGAESSIGEQGPGATAAPSLKPIPTSTVQALAGGISGATLVDPTLRQAAAFAPVLPEPPAAMNPALDVSLLSVGIVLLFVWMFWLYGRPEQR